MEFRLESLGIAGGVTQVFAELVRERLGLVYDPERYAQLADRLAPLVVGRGLTSFMDYYYVLKYSDDAAEWGRVIDALAVPETYFWRESDQMLAVVDRIVPELVSRAGGRPVRIWSVPCSTGEEPLTIAMMLHERGWFARAAFEILGSDASPAAVAKARAGVYGARAFRSLSAERRERYFVQSGPHSWTVSDIVRRHVDYDCVNLMDAADVTSRAAVPVVFCRNVFIYFSIGGIQRVVTTFGDAMPDPAYLCLGASESLLRLNTPFELKEIGGAFVYVKGGAVAGQPALTVGTAERAS